MRLELFVDVVEQVVREDDGKPLFGYVGRVSFHAAPEELAELFRRVKDGKVTVQLVD